MLEGDITIQVKRDGSKGAERNSNNLGKEPSGNSAQLPTQDFMLARLGARSGFKMVIHNYSLILSTLDLIGDSLG